MLKSLKFSSHQKITKSTPVWIVLLLSLTSLNIQAASQFSAQTCNTVLKEETTNKICHLAIKGDPKARYTLARLFADPQNPSIRNMDYSFYWHLKLARQILKENLTDPAYIDILYNTGVLYNDGLGTKANSKKAFYWFEQASKRGHPLAMTRLFLAYENGQGTKKDTKKALEWLQKAVKLNNPEAQIIMAQQLMEGVIVAKDVNKGVTLLKSAALEDSAKANYILGKYYLMAPEMQNPPHLTEAKNYFGNSCKLHFLLGCKRYYDLDNPNIDLTNPANKANQSLDFK